MVAVAGVHTRRQAVGVGPTARTGMAVTELPVLDIVRQYSSAITPPVIVITPYYSSYREFTTIIEFIFYHSFEIGVIRTLAATVLS